MTKRDCRLTVGPLFLGSHRGCSPLRLNDICLSYVGHHDGRREREKLWLNLREIKIERRISSNS